MALRETLAEFSNKICGLNKGTRRANSIGQYWYL